jgi:hypothetical protein
MGRLLLPLAAIAIVIVAYRTAAARCREAPRRRPWVITGSVGALGLAASLIPWLFADLEPPYSESPAGIFVYLGKALVVGFLGLGGLGALIGAIAPGHTRSSGD